MSHAVRPDASGHQPVMFDTTSRLVAIIIGVLAVIAGLVVGINNPLLNNAAGREGSRIDQLFSLTLGIATVVFVLVQGFLLYSIVRFGQQPGDDTDGPPVRGNTRLEFFWTLIPAVTIFFVGFVSYATLANIEQPAGDEVVVEVKAFQFAWQFYYPEYDVTSAELHAPIDRQLHLKLRSNDVVHSFWVPAMRIKKDAMPDRVTETYITPTETGSYPIVCTELCGAGHAVMRSQMVVQSDADFRGWIAGQQKIATQAAAGVSDPLAKGRQVFNSSGCNACHILKDAGAAGVVGPNLDGIGTAAAGREPGKSAEEYIHQSIVKPNEFVVQGYPANVMPQDYGQRLAEPDLDALVKYLTEMK
ncbi:MAG: cytochrome c oxidase subunit II [Nitrososphaerales archaeon]